MKLAHDKKTEDLREKLNQFWELSGQKILSIEKEYDASKGSPVFTEAGKYTTRGHKAFNTAVRYYSSMLQVMKSF